MNFDFYVIAKIILITCIWVLILLCILFILNSKRIYSGLKAYEDYFRNKKREVIHGFVPVMANISRQNKNFQKEILLLIFPFIYKGFIFFQSTKLGIDLTKKIRNNIFS